MCTQLFNDCAHCSALASRLLLLACSCRTWKLGGQLRLQHTAAVAAKSAQIPPAQTPHRRGPTLPQTVILMGLFFGVTYAGSSQRFAQAENNAARHANAFKEDMDVLERQLLAADKVLERELKSEIDELRKTSMS